MSRWRVWAAMRSSGTPASAAVVAWPARSEWAVIRVPSSPAASARALRVEQRAAPGARPRRARCASTVACAATGGGVQAMTETASSARSAPADRWAGAPATGYAERPQPASLADVLERVLDKGVVIAGDIRVNLLDIELLTIKIRLLLVSVDKAREIGIDWWENDPLLSSTARDHELNEENARLRERVAELEAGDE